MLPHSDKVLTSQLSPHASNAALWRRACSQAGRGTPGRWYPRGTHLLHDALDGEEDAADLETRGMHA